VRSLTRTDIPAGVFTDSEYVVKGLTEWLPRWVVNGWRGSGKKPVVNRELWEALKAAVDGHVAGVTLRWVKGHAGNPGNEEADAQANAEAARAAEGCSGNAQTLFCAERGLVVPLD
jgi:ribonuclease HI